ncbi:transcription factor [Clarireedia jacksonii]
MKPFRLSKFMAIQSGLERQVPKTATPRNGTCSTTEGKKSRAKHYKVKTGCLTCRGRRIKCDETKPVCRRCQKTNIQCSGYSNDSGQKDPSYQNNRSSLIKFVSQSTALHPVIHSGTVLLSEQDGRYFRYYRETSAAEIARLFNGPFWDSQILQASENEAFISQALVTLGAISKAETESARQAYQHRQYASQSYAKALSCMRQSLNGSSYNSRKALIACLLVYTIEVMLGHFATAATHASCGEKLLYRDFFNRKNKSYSPFRCQRDASIDDDLCRAFSDLSLQVFGIIDNDTLDFHRERMDDLTHALRFMPPKFSNLQEAYDWWQLIIRRSMHWISLTRRTMLGKQQRSRTEVMTENEGLSVKSENCPWFVVPVSGVHTESCQECAILCDDIMRWQSVASPLLVQGMKAPTGSLKFFASHLLKIQSIGMAAQLRSVFAINEIYWDQFYLQFERIMHYMSKIRSHLFQGQGKYHLDFGIVPFVSMVAIHCRNRVLRSQAIEMLSTNHGYREGMWHGEVTSMIARFVRDVEEEWADEEGWVPGERRFAVTGAKIVFDEVKSVYVCGYQKNGTMDGEETFKEAIFKEAVFQW